MFQDQLAESLMNHQSLKTCEKCGVGIAGGKWCVDCLNRHAKENPEQLDEENRYPFGRPPAFIDAHPILSQVIAMLIWAAIDFVALAIFKQEIVGVVFFLFAVPLVFVTCADYLSCIRYVPHRFMEVDEIPPEGFQLFAWGWIIIGHLVVVFTHFA